MIKPRNTQEKLKNGVGFKGRGLGKQKSLAKRSRFLSRDSKQKLVIRN